MPRSVIIFETRDYFCKSFTNKRECARRAHILSYKMRNFVFVSLRCFASYVYHQLLLWPFYNFWRQYPVYICVMYTSWIAVEEVCSMLLYEGSNVHFIIWSDREKLNVDLWYIVPCLIYEFKSMEWYFRWVGSEKNKAEFIESIKTLVNCSFILP